MRLGIYCFNARMEVADADAGVVQSVQMQLPTTGSAGPHYCSSLPFRGCSGVGGGFRVPSPQ